MRKLAVLAGALTIAALAGRPATAAADLGVGISLSEIKVEEKLAQGGRYQLPAVTVTNTGTEAARYEVVITSIQDQEELVPDADWFRFQPQSFDLTPGQSQTVSISLNPDGDAEPGDYFALIEAHPIQADTGVTIGVAAAAKLSFEVKPSSLFELWRLRVAHFFEDNSPFSIVLPPTLAGLLLLYWLSRRFRLRIERRP
jgi:hypothetical protein